MSLFEVLKEIREKTKIGAEDHGLYDPGLERGRTAVWLKESQSLHQLGLVNNVFVSNANLILFSRWKFIIKRSTVLYRRNCWMER